MADYVKPSIPRPIWEAVRQAAAAEGLTITAWLARAADGSTPAPATPPEDGPQPTRPEHLGDRTDYGTGAMAARLRDRSTG